MARYPARFESDVGSGFERSYTGRVGTPEDVANFAAFLASDEAGYITGAELYIDGGLSARYAG